MLMKWDFSGIIWYILVIYSKFKHYYNFYWLFILLIKVLFLTELLVTPLFLESFLLLIGEASVFDGCRSIR